MQSKTRLVQYLTGACAIWLLMAFTGGVAHWRQLAQDSARTSEQLVELLLMASELRISGEAANAETVAAMRLIIWSVQIWSEHCSVPEQGLLWRCHQKGTLSDCR